MPTVRRSLREVSTQNLPGVRRTAASTAIAEGAGVEQARADKWQALGQVSGRVASIGAGIYARAMEEERQAANQAALLEASNRLSDWKNKRLYDPQSGAMTLRGKDAQPLPEQLRGEFDEVTGEIEKGLGTPEQKEAFARLRSQEWQQLDLQVRRHVYDEGIKYRAGELDGTITNAVDAAQRAYLDPALVGVELQKAEDALRNVGPGLGMTPEQVEARVRAARSAGHIGVIQNLLGEERDTAARTYFSAVKGQIDADKLDDLTKALEAGELKGRAQKTSDQILLEGGTLADQRAKAKQIQDPDERDLVLGYLEHEAAVKERDEREAHETLLKRSFDVLDRSPNVKNIPTGDWAQMSPGERSAAWSYARQRAEGIPITTDQGRFYALMTEAGDNPEAFSKRNLMADRHRLSDSDLQQLAGLQLSIKSGKTKGSEIDQLAGFQTKKEIVDNTLASYGIDPAAKPNTPEGQAIANLMRMLDRRIDSVQTPDARGQARKATNTEIQQALDELLSQTVEVPGSWWNIWPGGKAGPFSTDKRRLVDLTIDDVPSATRTEIEKALRERRRPITDATILDVYREMQIK